MLWQVWHEHFIEVEWLSLECDLALHLLWLGSDGLCHLFVYRVSVTRPEAFIHGDSSVSARGKKHTVSHRCHNKKKTIHDLWLCQQTGLLEVLYAQNMRFFTNVTEGRENRNENGYRNSSMWDLKTIQHNRGRGARGETDIANQQAKVTGWHQRITSGL